MALTCNAQVLACGCNDADSCNDCAGVPNGNAQVLACGCNDDDSFESELDQSTEPEIEIVAIVTFPSLNVCDVTEMQVEEALDIVVDYPFAFVMDEQEYGNLTITVHVYIEELDDAEDFLAEAATALGDIATVGGFEVSPFVIILTEEIILAEPDDNSASVEIDIVYDQGVTTQLCIAVAIFVVCAF